MPNSRQVHVVQFVTQWWAAQVMNHFADTLNTHLNLIASIHFPIADVGTQKFLQNWWSHIDASLSRQPLVKGERLVRCEVNRCDEKHSASWSLWLQTPMSRWLSCIFIHTVQASQPSQKNCKQGTLQKNTFCYNAQQARLLWLVISSVQQRYNWLLQSKAMKDSNHRWLMN